MIVPLDETFDGFYSDLSRDQLPKGSVHRMYDIVPQNDAPGRRRGGWSWASKKLSNASAYVAGMGFFHKSGNADSEHLIVVLSDGNVYKLSDPDAEDGVQVGQLKKVKDPLTQQLLHFGNNVLIFKPTGGYIKWDGKKLSDGHTNYRTGWRWQDFLVVGNKGKNDSTNQIAFILATDLNNIVVDSEVEMPAEVVGGVGFPRQNLIFGYSDTWSLIGTQPPPGGDMRLDVLYEGCGCMDQRSIASTADYAVWVNSTGVFKSNGSELVDLTAVGGTSRFWQGLTREFRLQEGWIAAGGIFRDEYWITVTNKKGDKSTTLVCDLEKEKWRIYRNIDAAIYASVAGGINQPEEMYFGHRNQPRVSYVSTLYDFSDEDINSAFDADGEPILPVIETRYYPVSNGGEERVRHLYMEYNLSGAIGYTTMEVEWLETPESDEYFKSPQVFKPTSKMVRDRVDIRRKVRGISFRITQTDPSTDTRISKILLEGHDLSEMR